MYSPDFINQSDSSLVGLGGGARPPEPSTQNEQLEQLRTEAEAAGIASVQEDCDCIGTLLTSLETSLDFYVKGIRMRRPDTAEGVSAWPSGDGKKDSDESGGGGTDHSTVPRTESFASSVVDPVEAAEFIALILSVSKRCCEEGTLQAVLFDSNFDAFQSLAKFINAPMRYAPVQRLTMREDAVVAFQALRIAAVNAQKRLVTYCAKSPSRGSHLMSLAISAIRRYTIIDELMQLLRAPMTPEEVRKTVVETLFVICSHSQGLEYELMKQDYSELLPMAILESNEDVRGYLCAIAREVIGKKPRGKEVVESASCLLKLMNVDNSVEVRALCISGIEEIVRGHLSPQSQGEREAARLLSLTEIVESIVSRLDRRSEPSEVLELLCRLLDACVSLSCQIGIEVVFRVCNDHNIHIHLLALLERGVAVAAHAARALRVLLERAPPFLSLAPRLVVGEAMQLLLAAVIRLGRRSRQDELRWSETEGSSTAFGIPRSSVGADGGEDVVTSIAIKMLAVELAVIVGMTLLYSPVNRRKFNAILQTSEEQFSLQEVLHHLHNCLTTGEIDYFADVLLVDEEGIILNDPNSVEWVDETQPEQRSLHGILDAQEIRRNRNPAGVARWKVVEAERRRDLQKGYLAFVLLGYVVFRLTSAAAATSAAKAAKREHGSSALSSPAIQGLVSEGLLEGLPSHTADIYSGRTAAEGKRNATTISAGDPTQTSRAPLFPTAFGKGAGTASLRAPQPSGRTASGRGGKSPSPTRASPTSGNKRQAVDDETPLGASFKACFQLCTTLAKYYEPTGCPLDGPTKTKYVAAGGGLVMRSQKHLARNPWDPKPINRNNPSWTVDAVREGDLFLFSIPLEALTTTVIEAVIQKAERHALNLRKSFVTTPQRQKERRFFLTDAMNSVLPQTITLLRRLNAFLDSHSDKQIQMALGPLPDVKDSQVEKSVNPGNIIKCVDYLTSYFSKSSLVAGHGNQNSSFSRGSQGNASFGFGGGGGTASFAASPIPMSGEFDESSVPLQGAAGNRKYSGGGAGDMGPHDRSIYSVSKSLSMAAGTSSTPGMEFPPRAGGPQYYEQVLGMKGQIGGELFPNTSTSTPTNRNGARYSDPYSGGSPGVELSPRSPDDYY